MNNCCGSSPTITAANNSVLISQAQGIISMLESIQSRVDKIDNKLFEPHPVNLTEECKESGENIEGMLRYMVRLTNKIYNQVDEIDNYV